MATQYFADHLADLGADHVDAEDAIGRGVGEHLHEALGLVVHLGAAVGHERELADLVVDAVGLQLFLGLPDRGDLRDRCR